LAQTGGGISISESQERDSLAAAEREARRSRGSGSGRGLDRTSFSLPVPSRPFPSLPSLPLFLILLDITAQRASSAAAATHPRSDRGAGRQEEKSKSGRRSFQKNQKEVQPQRTRECATRRINIIFSNLTFILPPVRHQISY